MLKAAAYGLRQKKRGGTGGDTTESEGVRLHDRPPSIHIYGNVPGRLDHTGRTAERPK